MRPRFADIFATSGNQRAQGMPDARCTRGLMRNVHKKCAHEHTGQRRTSDIPCAMALRLITCSPRRTALLPPLRPEKQLPPVALTPAPRRQDHTSLPYALAPLVSGTTSVHRKPSLVGNDGLRPSEWDGMARDIGVICPSEKQKYFSRRDWTSRRREGMGELICPTGSTLRRAD